MHGNHDEEKTDIETVGLRGWYSPDCDKGINGLKSVNLIAELVKHLPNKPGVYRMLGENGDVLYVGKARNLKKRVANYTRLENNTKRIARMIRLTNKMEFIVTHSEAEALLLEADLIKKLLPRFNILLRHDKSFPYIVITDNHHAPGIFTHRGARARRGAYFGPFASAGAANDMISDLQRAFLLRTCTDSVYETRTRPCLLHQIKRCSAPCTNTISREDYEQLVTQTKAFLSGNSRIIKNNMTEDMNEAAEKMDFERAALYRDRLAALSHGLCDPGINPRTIDDADVFAICRNDGLTSVQVLFFRGGQSRENRAYFPNAEPSRPMSEVLEVFLAQFYHNKPIPGLILLSAEIAEHALLTKSLSLKTGHKVQIITPRRGEKKQLVQYALAKAGEALARRLAEKQALMPVHR